mmetsp:Transcript_57107/g.121371  ORF Transcript_57107/g.121371 Transcript_57107/m.121371 type:complete len:242 (-) Transcript_57107:916-1641(-)
MPAPVLDHGVGPLRQSHLLSVGTFDGVREVELSEGSVGDGRPKAEGLRDDAVQQIELSQVLISRIPSIQEGKELIHFLLHRPLKLGPPGELEEHPGHGVACGVMAREQDDEHVSIFRGWVELASLQGATQGSADRTAGGHLASMVRIGQEVRRNSARGVLAGLLHDVFHSLAELTDGGLGMTHEGLPNVRIRSLHEVARHPQQSQLQLGLRFVQQEVAHVDRRRRVGQLRQSIGTSLGPLE